MNKLKRKNLEKGITLIALIITIVVLLILAVVTISAVQDGGIIQHAKNATNEYEIGKEKEKSILQGYLDFLNGNRGNEPEEPGEPEVSEPLREAGLYDENWNLVTSWEDLVDNGIINVSADDKTINSGTDTNISGKLVISENVTSIGDSAFNLCTNITEVTIPNSLTSIGDSAFGECFSLTSVTIGNSVTSIGNRAFDFCHGITEITIPNSVTSIGNSAFRFTGLTEVNIPNSVTSIGTNAFQQCLER